MKHKVGDRVRIKSIDWYNENKNKNGYIDCGNARFIPAMSTYCGKVLTMCGIEEEFSYYHMKECQYVFMDEMIEGLVEEETKVGTALNPIEPKSNANCLTLERVDELDTKIDKDLPSGNQNVWELPDGYQFVDENGNVINATKIVLEKKKKEYPKTFLECCDVLNIGNLIERGVKGYKAELFDTLQKLYICRDAYYKIAGDEMGLGKPWEPDWTNQESSKYCIAGIEGKVKTAERYIVNTILTFPTEEMRDAFYENFKELIEQCKELL